MHSWEGPQCITCNYRRDRGRPKGYRLVVRIASPFNHQSEPCERQTWRKTTQHCSQTSSSPAMAAVPGMVSSLEQIQISSGMSVWHSGPRGACSSTRAADSLGTFTTLAQGYVNALALGIRWPPETWTAWIPMTSCSLDHLSKKRLMILRLLERTHSRKWNKKNIDEELEVRGGAMAQQ